MCTPLQPSFKGGCVQAPTTPTKLLKRCCAQFLFNPPLEGLHGTHLLQEDVCNSHTITLSDGADTHHSSFSSL